MAHIDETFYKNVYKGFIVPSAKFGYYSERASEALDSAINETLTAETTTDVIKKATCAIMDVLYNSDNKKELKAEKNGTVSKTYQDSTKLGKGAEIQTILNRYLSETGLLYRGVENDS